MFKKLKPILSLLLAFTLIFSVMPVSAFAENGTQDTTLGDSDIATFATTNGGGLIIVGGEDDPDALLECVCPDTRESKCAEGDINADCPVCADHPEWCVFDAEPPEQQAMMTIPGTLDFTIPSPPTTGDGFTWDSKTKTLTINGLDVSVSDGSALYVPDGTTIIFSGTNSIVSGTGGFGLVAMGDLALQGSAGATLTAKGLSGGVSIASNFTMTGDGTLIAITTHNNGTAMQVTGTVPATGLEIKGNTTAGGADTSTGKTGAFDASNPKKIVEQGTTTALKYAKITASGGGGGVVPRTKALDLTVTTVIKQADNSSWGNPQSDNIDAMSTEGWAWYATSNGTYAANTLVLNGLDLTVNGNNAIKVPGGTTIIFSGTNSLVASGGYALGVFGDLDLQGSSDATLTANGSTCGVYIAGNFTMTGGGTLIAKSSASVAMQVQGTVPSTGLEIKGNTTGGADTSTGDTGVWDSVTQVIIKKSTTTPLKYAEITAGGGGGGAEPRTKALDLTATSVEKQADSNSWGNPRTDNIDAMSTEGWAWYATSNGTYAAKTLVLNGLDLTVSINHAIMAPVGTTIIFSGTNSIVSSSSGYAIIAMEGLVLQGSSSDATLTASGSNGGVYIAGNFTMTGGGTLIAKSSAGAAMEVTGTVPATGLAIKGNTTGTDTSTGETGVWDSGSKKIVNATTNTALKYAEITVSGGGGAEPRTKALNLTAASVIKQADSNSWGDPTSANIDAMDAEGWKWYKNAADTYDANTLVLDGLDLTVSTDSAIIVPGGTTIVLADGSTNVIVSTYSSGDGIQAKKGGLIIKGGTHGTGILSVTGGTYGFGINVDNTSTFTMESGVLTATGLNGISGLKNFIMEGGTVTATDTGAYNYGIYTTGNFTMTGGTIAATGSYSAMAVGGTISMDGFGIKGNQTGGGTTTTGDTGAFETGPGTKEIVKQGTNDMLKYAEITVSGGGDPTPAEILAAALNNIKSGTAAVDGTDLTKVNVTGNITIPTSDLIKVESGVTLDIQSGTVTVSNNDSFTGITVENGGSLTVSGGTLTLSNTGNGGVGLYIGGTMTVSSGTVNVKNTGNSFGINVVYTTMKITGGTVNVDTGATGINLSMSGNVEVDATNADATLKLNGAASVSGATAANLKGKNGATGEAKIGVGATAPTAAPIFFPIDGSGAPSQPTANTTYVWSTDRDGQGSGATGWKATGGGGDENKLTAIKIKGNKDIELVQTKEDTLPEDVDFSTLFADNLTFWAADKEIGASDVKWETNNKKVADVVKDDADVAQYGQPIGTVIAGEELGAATITVRSKDDKTISAFAWVTVVAPYASEPPARPIVITTNREEGEDGFILPDGKTTDTYTILDNFEAETITLCTTEDVTMKIDNTKIATIKAKPKSKQAFDVKYVGSGTATITVTNKDKTTVKVILTVRDRSPKLPAAVTYVKGSAQGLLIDVLPSDNLSVGTNGDNMFDGMVVSEENKKWAKKEDFTITKSNDPNMTNKYLLKYTGNAPDANKKYTVGLRATKNGVEIGLAVPVTVNYIGKPLKITFKTANLNSFWEVDEKEIVISGKDLPTVDNLTLDETLEDNFNIVKKNGKFYAQIDDNTIPDAKGKLVGSGKVTVTYKFTDGSTLDVPGVAIKFNVVRTAPKPVLSPAKQFAWTTNQNPDGSPAEISATFYLAGTEGHGIALENGTAVQQQKSGVGVSAFIKSIEVPSSNAIKITLDKTNVATASAKPWKDKGLSIPLKLDVILDGMRTGTGYVPLTVTGTITTIDTKPVEKPEVTVKAVAKNNIDLMNRENTQIIFVPTLKNTQYAIDESTLPFFTGADVEKANKMLYVEWDNGNAVIRARSTDEIEGNGDTDIIKGEKFNVKLAFALNDGKPNDDLTKAVAITKSAVPIKPAQSAVKHNIPKVNTVYQSRAGINNAIVIDLKPTTPAGAAIKTFAFVPEKKAGKWVNNPNNAYWFQFDEVTQELHIWVRDSALVTPGKNVNLIFEATYEGQGKEKKGQDMILKQATIKIPVTVK